MAQFSKRKNGGGYILRIEYDNRKAENRLYRTETGARKAAQRLMKKYDDITCRIFQEIGAVKQLSLFDKEADDVGY